MEEVIARAREAGVVEMLTVGFDQASNPRSVALAGNDGVYASVGIHPNSATDWDDQTAATFEPFLERPEVVAVGETGLDFYRDWAPPEDQERAFVDHIDLAKRYDKALVIHTRESLTQALDVLEREGPPARFVFHCWSGGASDLDRVKAMDGYVSFAGNVSFKSAADLRAVVPLVPRHRLLIETDSPYLTPVPHRGEPNSPANVVHVGAAIAGVLDEPPEQIAGITSANAHRFFAI